MSGRRKNMLDEGVISYRLTLIHNLLCSTIKAEVYTRMVQFTSHLGVLVTVTYNHTFFRNFYDILCNFHIYILHSTTVVSTAYRGMATH